jgi:hypothetical protein
MAIISTTAPTPIMIPSMVRKERILLAFKALIAKSLKMLNLTAKALPLRRNTTQPEYPSFNFYQDESGCR